MLLADARLRKELRALLPNPPPTPSFENLLLGLLRNAYPLTRNDYEKNSLRIIFHNF